MPIAIILLMSLLYIISSLIPNSEKTSFVSSNNALHFLQPDPMTSIFIKPLYHDLKPKVTLQNKAKYEVLKQEVYF